MALPWWQKKISRIISAPKVNIKKHYRTIRALARMVSPRPLIPRVKMHDFTVTVDDGYDVPVRLYTPKKYGGGPKIVFFHGGGWVLGTLNSYDGICSNLAHETQQAVLSVNYRRAPEHRFPRALLDCYGVVRAVMLDSVLPDTPPQQVTIMGDSAGGNLACALSLMARDRGEFAVPRQIMAYPACDNNYSPDSPYESVRKYGTGYFLTADHVRQFGEMYLSSETDRQNPYFAPMQAQDHSRQPKTLILTAEYDPLRDEAEAYGERLRAAGNDVTVCRVHDTLHGFLSLSTRNRQVNRCYDAVRTFLKEK